jgi:deoxyribose-phosphate aldolase
LATVEHTKLAFNVGDDAPALITQLCNEAMEHGFATVCVRPEHAEHARQCLGNSAVRLAGVVGFPEKPVTKATQADYPVIGAVNSTTKFQEISCLQMAGVDELDVVMNVAFFQTDLETGGNFTETELKALVNCADDLPIKLIIETDLLTPSQVGEATRLAARCGMAWVKTSTGFISDGHGATVETVALIRHTLNEAGYTQVGVKASGGISTFAQAEALLQAGANRLGTSRALHWLNASTNPTLVTQVSSTY